MEKNIKTLPGLQDARSNLYTRWTEVVTSILLFQPTWMAWLTLQARNKHCLVERWQMGTETAEISNFRISSVSSDQRCQVLFLLALETSATSAFAKTAMSETLQHDSHGMISRLQGNLMSQPYITFLQHIGIVQNTQVGKASHRHNFPLYVRSNSVYNRIPTNKHGAMAHK